MEAITLAPICTLYLVTLVFLAKDQPEPILIGLPLSIPLIWMSIRDLTTFEIPDLSIVFLLLATTLILARQSPSEFLVRVFSAVFVTTVFWIVGEIYFRLKGTEGLGIGDAKLFGAGTYLLGLAKLPDLLLLSSLGGILVYTISGLRGQGASNGIPFGPFIAYAIFVLTFIDPILIRSPHAF